MSILKGVSEREGLYFVAGRNRYNAKRRRLRDERRLKVMELIASGQHKPSDKKGLSEALGVCRDTIRKDVLALISGDAGRCPTCGQHWPQFADKP